MERGPSSAGLTHKIFNIKIYKLNRPVGVEMPPPSALKRKILLKNKRLKPDVEKMELELFLKGELQVNEVFQFVFACLELVKCS
jgi:hypothetical protein